MKKRVYHFIMGILVVLLAMVDSIVNTVKVVHADQVGAVDLNRLGWLGAGAGSKGIAAGMVSGLAPQAGVTPDMAAAFIGFWLAQQGGARMGPFGEGMLIAAVGQLIRAPIEGIFGQIGKGGPAPAPTPEAAAAAAATKTAGSPTTDVEAHLAATYGIV